MSPSQNRVGVIALAFVGGLVAVVLHLGWIMVGQHDEWLVRSYRNRWTFRDVPGRRGALLDRLGRVLAEDQPSFALDGHYWRFRRYHAVGAAVHGANLLLEQGREAGKARYGYEPGRWGPHQAYAGLVSMKVALLEPGVLQKDVGRDLRFYVTSVLSACSGQSWGKVYLALRSAHEEGRGPTVLQALGADDPTRLTAAFDQHVRELTALHEDLRGLGHEDGLLTVLDDWRRQWKEDRDAEDGRQREDMVRAIASNLSFDVAAALRVRSQRHPGLLLRPSLVRVRHRLPGDESILPALLGRVGALDLDYKARVLDERVATTLDDTALEELVSEGSMPLDEFREELRARARRHFKGVLRTSGRSGLDGVESVADEVLSGRPGLRLIERDKRAREHMLWSRLQVVRGEDVALTLDLDLQELAERVAEETYQQWLAKRRAIARVSENLDVALALIDAGTGDVLAVTGRPLRLGEDRVLRQMPPGFSWRSSGDIGSLAKPFLLLEQMDAEGKGRPCKPDIAFKPCGDQPYQVRPTLLRCWRVHGADGRDGVGALAESCNTYLYQVAEGLGRSGVRRALHRVGLAPPGAGVSLYLQRHVLGVPSGVSSEPRVQGQPVQKEAIGYGVEASVLHVARAYAALATGRLPTLSLIQGERAAPVALDVTPYDLGIVQRGLRQCVVEGTAKKLTFLQELGASGKTGTAEITKNGDNNAWFAGFLPRAGQNVPQLAFAGVVYFVPDDEHGGDVSGAMVSRLLERIDADPKLRRRYLPWRDRR